MTQSPPVEPANRSVAETMAAVISGPPPCPSSTTTSSAPLHDAASRHGMSSGELAQPSFPDGTGIVQTGVAAESRGEQQPCRECRLGDEGSAGRLPVARAVVLERLGRVA
jgi:hypothetical protein